MTAEANNCCSCCSSFILTIGLTALFIWLSLRVDEPRCYLEQIYIPTLNKTLNSSSNSTLIFTLKLVNPNKDKGIQYDDVQLRFGIFFNLNTTRPVGNATVDRFYQGHEKKAKKPGSLIAGNLTATVDGKVYLRVDFTTAVKYKILLWYSKRDHLWGGANVEIGDSGVKVEKKAVRLGNSPMIVVESGAPMICGRYRALMVPLFVAVVLSFNDSTDVVFKHITSILHGNQSVKKSDSKEIDEFERMPNVSGLSHMSQINITFRRRELSREKKRKCRFKIAQDELFQRLIQSSANILGTEATLELFGKVGRKPGVKGYNALVKICINKAKEADDNDIAMEELGKVLHLFELMKEQGLEIKEKTYGPLLLYLIDMSMVDEFELFCHLINDENPSSITRLGYYEMMLWLRVNNQEKIRDLCKYIVENDAEDTSDLKESYLLALCESDRKENILEVLEIIDIEKLSSESVTKIFQALGRLQLEPVAEKFLWDFKTSDHEADNITNFIASYAVSNPELPVEDAMKNFKDLHQKLEVSPSSSSYEKLISHSCALQQVHAALDIVDEMRGAGLTPSILALQSILQISDETFEFNLHSKEGKQSGNKATEQIFMALIKVYASCEQLEKAKQVILDPLIPVDSLNRIKSVLVSVLASHGQLSDAVLIYEETKQSGQSLEPKVVMSLIEHTRSEGELDQLLLLLEELNGTTYWNDACCRIILYCIWNKYLSSAIELCKLLKDKLQDDEKVMEVLYDKVFSPIEESKSNHMYNCLELLSEIKDKLGIVPSQK